MHEGLVVLCQQFKENKKKSELQNTGILHIYLKCFTLNWHISCNKVNLGK